jgi:tetratricopeptide (TPR) repeat protein
MSSVDAGSEAAQIISEMGRAGGSDQLLKSLERINTISHGNAAHYTLAGQHDKAARELSLIGEAYEKAISLINADSVTYASLTNLVDTFKEVSKYWKEQAGASANEGSRDRISSYINIGSQQQSSGDYKRSIESFSNAIKSGESSSSETAELWNETGNSYYYSGNFQEAKKSYERAVEAEPYNAVAWANLGLVSIALEDYEAAIRHYKKAMSIDRGTPDFYLAKLGIANYRLGRYNEALDLLLQALKENPNSVDVLVLLGAIYNDGFSEYEKARECFDRAFSLDPASLLVKINLAEILLILDDYDRSEAFAKDVRDRSSENYGFIARFLLVCLLYWRERYYKASAATIDLLSYYESLPQDYVISWNFTSLSKKIREDLTNTEIRDVLLSLISLKEALRMRDEKESILNGIRQKVIVEKKWWRPPRIGTRSNDDALKLDIEINNTSAPDASKEGYYFWEIHLVAPDDVLADIAKVIYYLHPSFLNPVEEIDRERDPDAEKNGFRLSSRGWGEFRVKVKITFKDGIEITKYHWLKLAGPTPLEGETDVTDDKTSRSPV